MILEYQNQLDIFSIKESKNITAKYFKKYWLRKSEYFEKWDKIQKGIFKITNLKNGIFKFPENYKILPLRGGLIFSDEDFNQLMDCLKVIGEKNFVVVETLYGDTIDYPFLKFKYPCNIDWTEIKNGGYLTLELFEMPHKNYLVYGESGLWGKFVFNESEFPLDIIVFHEEFSELFLKTFLPKLEELEELANLIDPYYKTYVDEYIEYRRN